MRPVMSFSVICVWLFLAAISAPTSVCGAPILDTSGNPLRQGVPYHIVPAKPESGGGVMPVYRWSNVSGSSCPFDVGQSSSPSYLGLPVYFFSFSRLPYLRTTDRIRVEFGPVDWSCTQSKTWRIRHSPESKRTFVSTGGAQHLPESQFGIYVEGDAYKLVHRLAESSNNFRNIGVFTDNENVRRLTLRDEPLGVKFRSLFEPGIIPWTKHYEETMSKTFPFY